MPKNSFVECHRYDRHTDIYDLSLFSQLLSHRTNHVLLTGLSNSLDVFT